MAQATHSEAVFGFRENVKEAGALAGELGIPHETVGVHTFPDQETLVKASEGATKAILFRSLYHPNPKLFEVIQAASVLRDLGAKKITLVSPYIPYMRQDKVFNKGESFSQKVFSGAISPWIDGLVTVEPHLHRTRTMESVFPGLEGAVLSGAVPLAGYFREHPLPSKTLIVGPDEEAWRAAKPLAAALGLEWTTALKKRLGDKEVRVTLPDDVDFKGKPVLIADDVISSGMTVINCAHEALARGAASVTAATTHALFDQGVFRKMKQAGVTSVVSTDSIPHFTNAVALAPYLADVLKAG